MKSNLVRAALFLLVVPHSVAAQAAKSAQLVEMVTRMAKIGRAASPTFSPDGTRIAFVSDRTGVPQVWVAAVDGGAPLQITKGDDPVGRVIWSPDGAWLALSLAPGGGMNTQIYVVRPDGTGLRRLTDGGKETNNLGAWTRDGRRLTMGSNRATPSAIDAYLVDPVSGERELVSANKGLQTVEDVSRDGARALVARLRGRGDNDLYVVNLRSHAEVRATPHEPPDPREDRATAEATPSPPRVGLSAPADSRSEATREFAGFLRALQGGRRTAPRRARHKECPRRRGPLRRPPTVR